MAKEKNNLNTNPEDQSLKLALPVAVFSYIFFVIASYFWQNAGNTLDNRVLALCLISVSTLFPLVIIFRRFKIQLKSENEKIKAKTTFNHWFWKVSVLSIAYAILFGTVGLLLSLGISQAFKDFVYGPLTLAIWPALLAAFWTYFSINLADNFKPDNIVNILGIFLVGGVGLSAILNPNPQWWDESVSYLGMYQYFSAKIFNVTMIFTGALLLTLATFLFHYRFDVLYEKKMITKRALQILKAVFVIGPIGFACVGIFHYEPTFPRFIIHNFSAYIGFGVFGALMFFTYWLMPFFSKYYMRINYALFAVLSLIGVLSAISFLTLALTEIMSFGVISVWMVIFLRSLNGILAEKA